MVGLRGLVGRERPLAEIARTIHFEVTGLSANGVGAMLVTCADESEHECVDAFQHGLVQFVLPSLKFARQSPFRLANLGGRYEWGAIRIAEQHFATPPTRNGFKVVVVKINSHVAYEEQPATGAGGQPSYRLGSWRRYDTESACCGALAALLGDGDEPFTQDLRELFQSEGRDRIAELLDEDRLEPRHRALFAAMVSARLQARKAVLDIQDYQATTPTVFLVAPCITVNRHERDTEIVCGVYTLDGRGGGRDDQYFGLGDDPTGYEIRREHGLFEVSDEQLGTVRQARDHRALAGEALRRAAKSRPPAVEDERLQRIRHDVQRNKHRDHRHARTLLRAALPILAEVAPVPAAILMFASGAVGIHHAFRIHKLTREMAHSEEARAILDEIHQRVDRLEPDRAEALIELLMRDYTG